MAWPGVAEFSKAIQNPGLCFEDWELTQGNVATYPRGGRAGMPIVSSGNFASVYRVSCNGGDYAVRCFTRTVRDQRNRYMQLDNFLRTRIPQSFVVFQFLEKGILVEGNWYPLVKMEFVDGRPLDKFVEDNLNAPDNLQRIAARWRGAVSEIGGLGIAHNDLQHGNVMVESDRTIRLVDYDAMYLPQYQGQTSPEDGHQNFQHPLKTIKNYSVDVDNFPALVIYVSLLAIAADPGLFQRFHNDDNLIFTKKDYQDPANSECFRILKNQNPDDAVRHLTEELEKFCSVAVEDVPKLEELLVQGPAPAPATAAPAPSPAPAPSAAPSQPGGGSPQAQPAGSSYRNLLQGAAPQAAAATAAPPSPAVSQGAAATATASGQATGAMMTCSGCGSQNSVDLIYCENPSCISPVHMAQRFCAGCGTTMPQNAQFCHECGRAA